LLLFTSVNAVATMPGNANIAIMAIKGAGIWRSTAAAIPRTWTRVPIQGADRVLSGSNVPGAASSMMLGLHAGGVWRSDTAGNAFNTFFPPTVSGARADFAYGTSDTQVNPFTSIWQLAATAGGPAVYATAGNVAMHYGNDPPGLFRWNGSLWEGIGGASTGAPWNIVGEAGQAMPSEPVYGASINAGDDTVVYASYLGGGKGILRRESGGGSWTLRTVPGATAQVRATVPAATPNQNAVFALPFDDKVVRSLDFGATYASVTVNPHGFERVRFFGLAQSPTNASIWVGATNKGVYYSSDFGVNWTRAAAGPMVLQAVSAVGFKPTGRAFAADTAGNRYCSADGGANWVKLVTGVATFNAGVNAIKVFGGQLYYLTDGAGAYREDGSC
jgi:hypothetical protein